MSRPSSGRTLHERFGGTAACRQLAVAFYGRVERHPALRPLFPGKSFTCAIEEFTAFLVQLLDGPGEDCQRRWWLSLRESHMRFKISPERRAAWMTTMAEAFQDVSLDEPFHTELLQFFEQASAHVVNQGPPLSDGAVGPPRTELGGEFFQRWNAHKSLDDVVAAIRAADAPRAIAAMESGSVQLCGRVVLCGLLALMIRSGDPAMVEYVAGRLARDPGLRHQRFASRTLLHDAAAAGSAEIVRLLLRLGMDPDTKDGGEHTPLYSLANECRAEEAQQLVRVLAGAGADVNAQDGVKRCTPLHMAARRGSCAIAQALLDCGAALEARDSQGDTPLRRAVNCNQVEMAAQLLARGANPHSIGSKGLTPARAARSFPMQQLFR